jgi:hypothetical protein
MCNSLFDLGDDIVMTIVKECAGTGANLVVAQHSTAQHSTAAAVMAAATIVASAP